MSFGSKERSRQSGQPVNLLRFQWSSQDDGVLGYTDHNRVIIFDGISYQPIAVRQPSIKASGTLDRSRVEFGLPKNIPLVELYRVYPPSEVTTLRVFQGHANDPNNDFKLVWAGRVLGVRIESPVAIFTCEPVSSALKRVGLRRPWSIGCPHVLYGPQCDADQVAATTEFVLDSNSVVGSNTILIPLGTLPATILAYVLGLVVWCTDRGVVRRTIIGAVETSDGILLTLNGPTSELELGVTIQIVKGCNHQQDHCLDEHDNIRNYGGWPLIPTENPTSGRKNQFY